MNALDWIFRFGTLKLFQRRNDRYMRWNLELYVPGIWHSGDRTWLDMTCLASITWGRYERSGGLRVFGFGVGFAWYPLVRP